MGRFEKNGAFTSVFAKRKKWKIDAGLSAVLIGEGDATGILPPKCSVNDYGAGAGEYVGLLRCNGFQARGFDATEEIDEISGGRVTYADLSEDRCICPVASWGICVEVGEHIPEPSLGAFIANVAGATLDGLIISWAVPGQRGTGHVSCREPEWVAEQFAGHGLEVSGGETVRARQIAGGGWTKKLLILRRIHDAAPLVCVSV